jgi:hypothetical protein
MDSRPNEGRAERSALSRNDHALVAVPDIAVCVAASFEWQRRWARHVGLEVRWTCARKLAVWVRASKAAVVPGRRWVPAARARRCFVSRLFDDRAHVVGTLEAGAAGQLGPACAPEAAGLGAGGRGAGVADLAALARASERGGEEQQREAAAHAGESSAVSLAAHRSGRRPARTQDEVRVLPTNSR